MALAARLSLEGGAISPPATMNRMPRRVIALLFFRCLLLVRYQRTQGTERLCAAVDGPAAPHHPRWGTGRIERRLGGRPPPGRPALSGAERSIHRHTGSAAGTRSIRCACIGDDHGTSRRDHGCRFAVPRRASAPTSQRRHQGLTSGFVPWRLAAAQPRDDVAPTPRTTTAPRLGSLVACDASCRC